MKRLNISLIDSTGLVEKVLTITCNQSDSRPDTLTPLYKAIEGILRAAWTPSIDIETTFDRGNG